MRYQIVNRSGEKMIITDKGLITHIKSAELRFINKEHRYKYGIMDSILHVDDLMILVTNAKNYSKFSAFFGDESIENSEEEAQYVIALTLFGKKSTGSILKTSVDLPEINTVYNGRSIELKMINEAIVECQVDGDKFRFSMNKAYGQLLIFGQETIKYWIYPEDVEDGEIQSLLQGEIFGKINWKMFAQAPLTLDVILDYFEDEPFLKKVWHTLHQTFERQKSHVITHDKAVVECSICGEKQVEMKVRAPREIEFEIEHLFYQSKAFRTENKKKPVSHHGFTSVISQSVSMMRIKNLLEKVSPTKANILLTGESGTGKTLIAQEIHLRSNRADQPFVMLNCAAIPESLIESELFGYEEGAFTGAKRSGKQGYFELAHRGTLFLDEIGELPLSSQGRLLEVLQSNSFYRIGGSKKITVDIRIIAATNLELQERVNSKLFRKDLFYRLNVFPIKVPPLRERIEDVAMLSRRILPKICDRLELEPRILGQEAVQKLTGYHWPGNVRELENVLERALIVCDGRVILPEHLQFGTLINERQTGNLREQLEHYEKSIIQDALIHSKYNKTITAQSLGIGRTTLFEKMKRYGLEGDLDVE